jgi:hypothetical protein
MNRFYQLLIGSCLALLPNIVRADLIATISSTPIVVGNDIYLDVLLHSTSTDNVAAFNISYTINNPGLQFYADALGNPDELQLQNSSYVLYGNSLAAASPPGGSVSNSNEVYTQLDSVDSMTTGISFVAVGATDVLLATLHLVAITSGTYTISVDNSPQSGNGFIAPDSGSGVTPISFSLAPVDVTVTVVAVPEPSSLWLGVVGSAGLLGWAIRLRGQKRR